MGAKDARVQPIYNCKHREYITLVDSAGAVIAPSSPDTELSLDGAAFADATNELTEISSGDCYLDFAYSEMAATAVMVRPKSTGALTRTFTLFPQRLPVLRSGTAQDGAAATLTLDSSASAKDGAYVGCLLRLSNNTPSGVQGDVRKIIGYVGSTKVATVEANWTDTPTSSTTFEVLVPSDLSMVSLLSSASEVVDELETQMQADPTGFHVNVKEVNGTAQTAGDVSALINALNDLSADDVWDEVLHGSKTARQLLGITLAAFAAGKATGGGTTTITFRDIADGFNAIVATVDEDGNRSSVTLNFS